MAPTSAGERIRQRSACSVLTSRAPAAKWMRAAASIPRSSRARSGFATR